MTGKVDRVDVLLTQDGSERKMVAKAKKFRTGSRGFFSSGKITLAGVKYQAQVLLVEIGSKSKGGQ